MCDLEENHVPGRISCFPLDSAAIREPASGAQSVGFSIQHRVQRFLDRPANHLAKTVADTCLVDPDHLPHGFGFPLLIHFLLLSESLKGTGVSVKCAKEFVRYGALISFVICCLYRRSEYSC